MVFDENMLILSVTFVKQYVIYCGTCRLMPINSKHVELVYRVFSLPCSRPTIHTATSPSKPRNSSPLY